jgi:hypothetical protein
MRAFVCFAVAAIVCSNPVWSAESKPAQPPAKKVEVKPAAKADPKSANAKAEPAKAEAAKKEAAKAAATPVAAAKPAPVSKTAPATKPATPAQPAPQPVAAAKPAPKPAAAAAKAAPAKPAAPPAKTARKARSVEIPRGQSAPISGRPPVVVWKRGMPLPLPAAEANDAAEAPPIDPAGPATREVHAPPPAPPPVVISTREQMLKALEQIRPGTTRADVLARLGQPVYTIGMTDGGTYLERCRFRTGLENIASIEFRDGVVAAVDKIAR